MKNTFKLLSLLTILAWQSAVAMGKRQDIMIKDAEPATSKPQAAQSAQADDSNTLPAYRKPLPVYLSELSNLNDYSLFANNGWDGNWYVGFNVCWIEMTPQPPAGDYRKAFIGAKLGRMKSRSVKGKAVWEKEVIPGSVYIAVSSTPSWKTNQQYFLAASEDLPLEGDPENAVEGVGEARWFWVEVPLANINLNGSNYIAVWSPAEYFVSVASAPILAGGWGGKKVNSWISNDVKGYPPLNSAVALKTGISVFEPAIAMKLAPAGTEQDVSVTVTEVKEGRENTSNKTFIADIGGDGIEKAWLEVSPDGLKWAKQGRNVYSTPYMLTLRNEKLPEGQILVRVGASDIWGNKGYSEPVTILSTKVQTK
jgi:hypothetical protein